MTVADSSTDRPSENKHLSLYEGSTQFQHWRFSPTSLRTLRVTQNQAAVAKIRDAFEEDSPGSSANIEFLSADEEHALVKLYVLKVGQLCAHFRFPEEVEATAMTYLKRFYLKNTVMDHHPKNVMLTALFLAAKTSNCPIGIDRYVNNIPKTKASDVLDLEFLVAQSLRFEFTVWHAHRALWGLWLDMQNLPDFNAEQEHETYEAALTHVRASRLTDVELIYTPSQIALTCYHLVAPELAEAWGRSKITDQNEYDSLFEVVRTIEIVIQQDGSGPEVEVVREVDKRLRICTNPEYVPGSKAYLAKQAQIETEAAAKRAKRAEEVKRESMMDNPFGNDLTNEVGAPGATIFDQAASVKGTADDSD
ncbi:hypothetical protein FRC03_005211 [Tulasnella sp. 419]|nr:hypothetical protein FRC02_011234 [Tulasnella sp. 418]KAG8961570.1 hypothetical protein FRC03_005211 [Tulasnella sp. 419]